MTTMCIGKTKILGKEPEQNLQVGICRDRKACIETWSDKERIDFNRERMKEF